jgi:hypothetical protein
MLMLQLLFGFLLLGALPTAAGAAKFYIDNRLGDLNPADKVTIAQPRPVQLLFTFETDGAANMRATNYLKQQIENEVRASGLFSQLGEGPAASGAVLSIRINNITERNAAGRGFAVGLTFGLAGATVTDRYVATFEYLPGPGSGAITRSVEHAVRATIGRTTPPENATLARNAEEAARTAVRQMLAHGLNGLAGDTGFVPGAAPAPAPAAAPAAEAVPTPAPVSPQ